MVKTEVAHGVFWYAPSSWLLRWRLVAQALRYFVAAVKA